MSNVFSTNSIRYSGRRGRAVGGPYGTSGPVLLGHEPALMPVFFDDGVRVTSGNGTNQYNANFWFQDLRASGGSSVLNHEIFLKLSRPVNEIAFISVAMGGFGFDLSNSSSEFGTAQSAAIRPRIGINLIKVPMDLGETYGLDNLTGTNSAWQQNNSVHGTLYQTSTNFDSFSGFGALLWDMQATPTVSSIIGGQTNMGQTFSTVWGIDILGILPVHCVSFSPAKTDGPYYGIHIFWQSSDFGIDALFSWKGTIDWSFNVDVENPRNVSGAGNHRAFVFDSGLYSF